MGRYHTLWQNVALRDAEYRATCCTWDDILQRIYNLREDIGESMNLATSHPEKVEELDKLIEDYLTEVDVVVPLSNPNFNPATFDPAKIGVQPGGLKMPPSFQSSQPKSNAGKPSKPVNDQSMLDGLRGTL